MLGIIVAVAIGVMLGSVLVTALVVSLMTNETVIKWYIKRSKKIAIALVNASNELEEEFN